MQWSLAHWSTGSTQRLGGHSQQRDRLGRAIAWVGFRYPREHLVPPSPLSIILGSVAAFPAPMLRGCCQNWLASQDLHESAAIHCKLCIKVMFLCMTHCRNHHGDLSKIRPFTIFAIFQPIQYTKVRAISNSKVNVFQSGWNYKSTTAPKREPLRQAVPCVFKFTFVPCIP